MRVITGSARGRKLKTLEGMDVRPTTDKVKEAMFSVIQFDIPGAKVLDLFAGSGQLGIEALSRGAEHCTFVDKSKKSLDIVSDNLKSTGFSDKASVFNSDSVDFAKRASGRFSVALLDPPYGKNLIVPALEGLESRIEDGGKVLCEHEEKLVLPEKIGRLTKVKLYKYGKVEVTLYMADGGEAEK